MHPFPTFVESVKTIAAFPGWSDPEPDTGYAWFNAPLEIDGVVQARLVLHGGCYIPYPDCNVVLELRLLKVPGRRGVPLMRVEWKSLTGGHTNPPRGDSRWSGRRVSDTHIHPFDLNWSAAQQRMRYGNIRMATEIDQKLQSFEDVRAYAGNRFKINNIDLVELPNWEYTLKLL
jgi:hypothetical protein